MQIFNFKQYQLLTESTNVTWIPKSREDYNSIRKMTKEQRVKTGMKIWDNRNQKSLYLFPIEWYDTVPEGFTVYFLDDPHPVKFDKTIHPKDNRFGCLPFGMLI